MKCHNGEIARDSLQVILQDFDLNLGRDCKRQAFFDLLRKWGWIYVRAEYWHPKQQGREGKGRARAYGIGPAMIAKFTSPSSLNTAQDKKRPIILCSTFSKASVEDEETGFELDLWSGLSGLIPVLALQTEGQSENDYLEGSMAAEQVLWPTD